jgi:hypothetical protein
MKCILDPELVQDIFAKIQQSNIPGLDRTRLAKQLFQLIAAQNFDCAGVNVDRSKHILPTSCGSIAGIEECFDPTVIDPALFDQAAKTLDCRISLSLRRCLGVYDVVPIHIMIDQFCKVTQNSKGGQFLYKRICILTKEFGRRFKELSRSQMLRLKEVTKDVRWVPVQGQQLATIDHAMLSSVFPSSPSLPFKRIHEDLAVSNGKATSAVEFLREIGCREV